MDGFSGNARLRRRYAFHRNLRQRSRSGFSEGYPHVRRLHVRTDHLSLGRRRTRGCGKYRGMVPEKVQPPRGVPAERVQSESDLRPRSRRHRIRQHRQLPVLSARCASVGGPHCGRRLLRCFHPERLQVRHGQAERQYPPSHPHSHSGISLLPAFRSGLAGYGSEYLHLFHHRSPRLPRQHRKGSGGTQPADGSVHRTEA